MDNLLSISAGPIQREPTPSSRRPPVQVDQEEFVRRYPTLSADAIADARVRLLDYARDVGDLPFLEKWLKDELPEHTQFFTDQHRIAITRAEKLLEEWHAIEREFGPGATLNLDHPYLRGLFPQCVGTLKYTDREI